MKRKALSMAIVAAAFSGGVMAADMGSDASDVPGSENPALSSGVERFDRLDTNQDGSLSREEAQSDPRLANQIDKLDTNGDGVLDQAEFSAMEGRLPSEVAPEGKPEARGVPGPQGPAGEPGVDTPPGLSTEPGASEAAPGRSM
ncbi:MAG TPA: EF-hand domain-containing protein [Alphaproteobacteria bacterium]|nr:EF-hand domain-containing protein [Alphaproteobacteria bacterium]